MTVQDRPSGPAGAAIDCATVVEIVTAYLEGVLDADRVAEVEAHLALCPGCRAYLDQMRVTIAELGHVPVDSMPPEAQEALLAAFRATPPPSV